MRAVTGVLEEVAAERIRQDAKWGEQNHPDVHMLNDRQYYESEAENWKGENALRVAVDGVAWDGILLEEVFEALAESEPEKLREELIQVAAVAAAWVEAIDRRAA